MRASGWRGICLGAGLTSALMGVALAPAGAEEKLESFAGTCSVEGTNKFSPPATTTQQPLTISYDATGHCTGTLNGREVSDAPVKMRSRGRSNGSCLHAETPAPGHGAMTFADGTTIRYSFDFIFVFSDGAMVFHGERSGSAYGRGSFLTQRTAPDASAECYGNGVKELPLDITLTTDSPLVNKGGGDGRDNSRSGPGGKQNKSQPLRLRVRPRRVTAGRRTRFAFRVLTPQRRPASRAVVRVAGRRVRTSRKGKAKITASLRYPGRWAVRASKRGFRGARAYIRVRRR